MTRKLPVVAAVFVIDRTYEYEHPVFSLPVVLSSCGLQIRHQSGQPQMRNDEDRPRRTFRIGADETLHTVIPIQGVSLVETDDGDFEFIKENGK